MTPHILVCPVNENLLEQLRGRKLVLRVDHVEEIPPALHTVNNLQIELHCLWLETETPLASITLAQDWRDSPLALYTPRLGPFPDFIRQLPALREYNLRVYLPVHPEENYTSLRLLSSLGIACAIVFNGQSPNWERLSDLMTYALLGLAPHAAIEPFHYIASHYHKHQRTNFNAVYFEDSSRYLHVDREGHVALSHEDLTGGNFLGGIMDLDQLDQHPEYTKHLERWRDCFLENGGCASCQGWRVCLGKFKLLKQADPGCADFFTELMELVEEHQPLKSRNKLLWQP